MSGEVVLLEKVRVGTWVVKVFSDGTARLEAHYWNRPNYVYEIGRAHV